jgi:preprotein translocase subunit SecD
VPQEKLGPLILTTSPNSGAKEDLITKRAVEFAETDLESASLAESSEPIPEQRGKKTKGNSTAIQIRLTEVAGKKMEQFSEKNLGKQIAILVDHEIVMAPTIQTIMGRNLMISGNFSPEEAKRMIGKIQQAARK